MSSRKRRPPQSTARADQRTGRPGEPAGVSRKTQGWRTWVLFLALLLVTLAAYQPAWHGGLLWDDDAHITASGLRSAGGLWRIWSELGATQQYYPVTHSAFWVQQALWGDHVLGYHVANILLHALSALLLVLTLRRLGIPGAWLAAVIFALHPVEAESVAWISELKNTLSAVFYMGAALAYLRFDRDRKWRWYALAMGLFVLALFSKTVTATLPAALLIVFWWQRGSLSLRHDVRPLAPFFAVGAAAGLFTVWVEQALIGAKGAEFDFNLVERCLIAGRAICFYLGKLLWPANLTFIYPRWDIDPWAWWQYLFPLGVAGLLVAGWRLRKRSRAPLAAMLFFCATLFPGLGFFNVFPFRYSFVADHFQYLAGVGVIVLFSAAVATLARRWRIQSTRAAALTCAIGGVLAFSTWNQSHQYVDAETLYRTTIRRNPGCWMAHNNLGLLIIDAQAADAARADSEQDVVAIRRKLDDAVGHMNEALRLKPDYAEAYNNLGFALQMMGRTEEAVKDYREALRLKPAYANACNNLGFALLRMGRPDEAAAQYEQALRLGLVSYETRSNLGIALDRLGRAEAVPQLEEALRLRPESAEAHANLGSALQHQGRPQDALNRFERASQLAPDDPRIAFALGTLLNGMGRSADAIAAFGNALRLQPDYVDARFNLGVVLQGTGRLAEAVAEYREALKYRPGDAEAHNNLGVALEGLGRLGEAASEYAAAVRLAPDFATARANLGRLRK
jgi:protein O-mannosyl-transferase